MKRPFSTMARILRRLHADRAAVAMVEFAYSLPVLMTLGLGGMEVANYTLAHMRVSQLAVSLADNASRAKQEVVTGVPRMREFDVNESFTAALLQAGNLDMQNDGRLILSSLEVNADGGQWIHWQRCFGGSGDGSAFGAQGEGETGTDFPGMGPPGEQVTAEASEAIMFAEAVYQYQPLMFGSLIPDRPIRKYAAMYVRDDRDLSQLFNPEPVAPVNGCGG